MSKQNPTEESTKTQARHTPGPLRITGPSHNRLARSEDGDYAILDSDNKIIAETFNQVDPDDFRPARENALLFAAAPELLIAIKQLMEAYESLMPGLAKISVHDYALINDAPVAAILAIAKAEGR